MSARHIEYVELYAQDRQAAVDYFVSLMGFTRVASAKEPDRESDLLRQGEVQLVVTGGPAARPFLEEHGDGFADIALACADVAATVAAVRAAGGSAWTDGNGDPAVSGFGDVRHTLIDCRSAAGHRMPPGRGWVLAPRSSGNKAFRARLLDHVAVCVEGGSLDAYADYYDAAFGMRRFSSEYVAVGDQAMDSQVVRGDSGRVTFTLVAPDPGREPGQLDSFLARNGGPGVQHLAFLVDDIVPTVRGARELGMEFLDIPGAYYDRLGGRLPGMAEEIERLRAAQVLADRDESGLLLQLFTRSPYERNTLFYEVIQRMGSTGFGASNIRALYEALAHELQAAE